MSKKEFFSSFEKNLSLDGGSATAEKPTTNITKTTKKDHTTKKSDITPKVDTTKVTTFRIKVDTLEKIHAIAYWERMKIQEVLDQALTNYIESIPPKELEKAIKAYSK